MAYSPSLDDVNEVSGYNPSLSDLPPDGAQIAASNQASMPNWQRGGADILAGLAQAGHGLLNAPHNIANSIGNMIGNPQLGQDVAPLQPTNYNFSSMLGVANPNLIDKGVQGVAQYAPYGILGRAVAGASGISSLPSILPNVVGGAAGGAAFGATQSQTPGMSAALGAPLGAAAETLPLGLSGLKFLGGKVLSAFDPEGYANQIVSNLSGGKSLEQNSQSLASDIRNSAQSRMSQASNMYNSVFNASGDKPIYQQGSILAGNPKLGNYQQLDPSVTDSYTGDLQDLNNQFTQNPTLQNAHNLQSQLGAEIRSLSKNRGDMATRQLIGNLSDAQGALKSDMSSFLDNQGLSSQYQDASNFYKNNVTPYFASKKLSDISRGINTNPGNIANVFKNPGNQVNQVVSDLGQPGINKILYSAIGQNTTSPLSLLGGFNKLDQAGLGSYVTKDLSNQFGNLSQKMSNRNLADKSTLGLTRAINPQNIATLKNYVPVDSIHNSLANFLNYGYRPTAQSGMANFLSGQK